MRSHRPLIAGAALGLLATMGPSSCSEAPADESAEIDPRSYYENYAEGDAESLSYAVPDAAAGSTEGGAAAPPREWPGVLDDNTFVDAGTSGFVDTAQDPLSTFALDVDTGSYAVARELLAGGHRPPPASIRPEEWVNAFEYGYTPPADTDLSVTVDGATASAFDDTGGTHLIRVGIQAREIADDERPPVALTLVTDTSGSMDIRDRLGLVKSSVALLAKHLRPDDTIAIVTYEDHAKALLEPTPVAETETILDAIDRLRPGGSTNMEAGLRMAYRQARTAYRDDAINAVVLASDGVANVGMTNPDGLAAMIQEAGDDGIHLVTVGYGMGNYNDHLMEQLADRGDGFYAYVDTFEEAKQLYVEDITGTLTVVARDARVQVEFDPAVVSEYRLIGYDNRALSDDAFARPDVDAGEIGAGHDVTALYEVRTNPEAGIEPGTEIGSVGLRWESVASGHAEQSATPVTLPETTVDEADPSLRLATTVADLAQLLKGAGPVADRGITLDTLQARAADLQADGVDGAAELVRVIEQAQSMG